MYTYPASSTGFDAAMPLWVQAGGIEAWVEQAEGPGAAGAGAGRDAQPEASENTKLAVQEPDKVILLGFKTEALKPLTGRTLGDVARERGKPPEEVIADLIVADNSRIQVVYFGDERGQCRARSGAAWMSFGSDAAAQAPEGVFLKSSTHPRAYGNFARLLGKYVRDEKRVPLAEAVRRMTSFPAANLGHQGPRRAEARPLSPTSPSSIRRRSPTARPSPSRSNMRSACAMCFVNGVPVLRDGEHTGATAGPVRQGAGGRAVSLT